MEDVAAVYVDDATVLAPAAGTVHTVLVFSGRVTNLAATWDGDRPALEVTAADFTADLANRDVGDEPWDVEAMGDQASTASWSGRDDQDHRYRPVRVRDPDVVAGRRQTGHHRPSG